MFKNLQFLAITSLLSLLVVGGCAGASEDQEPVKEIEKTTTSETKPSEPMTSTDATLVNVENQDPGGTGEYKFSPDRFNFSVGEKVQFNISAETEFHTFTVDELDIDVSLDGGDTDSLIFTFDKPGEYRLYCIPHESLGMEATITVK